MRTCSRGALRIGLRLGIGVGEWCLPLLGFCGFAFRGWVCRVWGFNFLLFSLFIHGVELCRGEGNDMVLKIGAVKQQMKINLGRLEKLS